MKVQPEIMLSTKGRMRTFANLISLGSLLDLFSFTFSHRKKNPLLKAVSRGFISVQDIAFEDKYNKHKMISIRKSWERDFATIFAVG